MTPDLCNTKLKECGMSNAPFLGTYQIKKLVGLDKPAVTEAVIYVGEETIYLEHKNGFDIYLNVLNRWFTFDEFEELFNSWKSYKQSRT